MFHPKRLAAPISLFAIELRGLSASGRVLASSAALAPGAG